MVTWVLMGWRYRRRTGITLTVVAVLGVVLWQLPPIIDGYISTRDLLIRSLAFGLLPLFLWAGALTLALWKRRSLLRKRFWNRWIAALLSSSVILGVLAYFSGSAGILDEVSLGGWIGQDLKGSSDVLGVLRLAGMVALVAAVAIPRHSGKLLKRALSVMRRKSKATGSLVQRPDSSSLTAFKSKGFRISMLRRAWSGRRESRAQARITVDNAPAPRVDERPVTRQRPLVSRRPDSAGRSLESQNAPPSQLSKPVTTS